MKVIRVVARWSVLLVLVTMLLSVILFRSLLADGVRALQYQPSTITQQISDSAEFTWLGKLYFYASHPVIDKTNRASAECDIEKSSAILGCYANGTIYVYDIDNTELKGVEDVTAAHETLHAAYTRLSDTDKQMVNGLLLDELQTLQGDEIFMERMKAYDNLDAADRLNELHSVVGTEVLGLSLGLEEYYSRYFIDRDKIANMYQGYSSVFFKLESEVKRLVAAYNQMVEERNDIVVSMNQRYDSLQAQMASARRSGFDAQTALSINNNIDEYNVALATVQQQLADYERKLSLLKRQIEESTNHQQRLNQTIDSSLAPSAQL